MNDNSGLPDYELFYQVLTNQRDSIFSDYDGSETCIVRQAYDTDNLAATPDLFDIFYWASTEAITVEEASEQLLSMMLDSINEIPEEYRLFTLTDYNIYSAECYSSQTASEAIQEIKLPEDTWIFSPQYTFDYTGRTFFSQRENCEENGYIAEDGLVVNLRQGMPEDMYYVIMKEGNVWRMERLSGMLRQWLCLQ